MSCEDTHTYYCNLASGEKGPPDGKMVVNLQKAFWQDALYRWRRMKDDPCSRSRAECALLVNSIGPSLHQLLGQNEEWYQGKKNEKRTADPTEIFNCFINDQDTVSILAEMPLKYKTVRDGFEEIMTAYKDIRHFGACKHQAINLLNFARVTSFMETAQNVWRLVIHRTFQDKGAVPEEQLALFQNDFTILE